MSTLLRSLVTLALLALAALAAWEAGAVRLGGLADRDGSRTFGASDGRGGTRDVVLGPAAPHWTPLDEMSPFLVVAVVVAEDPCFFEHSGFDVPRLQQAVWTNLTAGRVVRGASTITNQLVKNLFLWRDRSLLRKALEAWLTWRAERALDKRRILELYLNAVEWGPGVYGIGEASLHHFSKSPRELSPVESAWLVSLLPNPVARGTRGARAGTLERTERLLVETNARLRGEPPVCDREATPARRRGGALRVTYPPEGHLTSASSIYVLGTAPPELPVRVDGSLVVRSPAGHFAHVVEVDEGKRLIRVDAGATQLVRTVLRLPQAPNGSVAAIEPIARTSADVVDARAPVREGPGDGHSARNPLPSGTRVVADARHGDWMRIEGGGWIRERSLRLLGGSEAGLSSVAGARVETSGKWSHLIVRTTGKPPFHLELRGRRLVLRLYRSTGRIEPRPPGAGLRIGSIEARPGRDETVEIVVRLRGSPPSGYDASWTDDGLVVSLRHPPPTAADGAKPLDGLVVMLDAGHGGSHDPGARGPTGLPEKDATLALSRRLDAELRARGATVLRTREADTPLALHDRVDAIRRKKPDLVLSLHYDAHGDGRAPLAERGLKVYWYQPWARRLARRLHDDLVVASGTPPLGTPRRSLGLTEVTVAPAVLLELGFLTNPFEFESIVDPAERSRLAAAIADSVAAWRNDPAVRSSKSPQKSPSADGASTRTP